MPRLQNELCVLYLIKDYMKKSISDLMELINGNNLSDAIPEFFRLCTLILTISSTTSLVKRSFSAPKRTKTYQKNTTAENQI